MCLFPNDARLKWYASAPGGNVNENEDFWVMMNFVRLTQRRPIFDPTVIGIIKPTPEQIGQVLNIDPPPIHYTPQSVVGWDGSV